MKQTKILKLGVLDLLEHFWVGEAFVSNISTYCLKPKKTKAQQRKYLMLLI